MGQSQLTWIAGFIWNIADDVLRDVYVRCKYRDVILPMAVIRRLVRKEEYEARTVIALKDLHNLKLVEIGDFVISLRSFQGGIVEYYNFKRPHFGYERTEISKDVWKRKKIHFIPAVRYRDVLMKRGILSE